MAGVQIYKFTLKASADVWPATGTPRFEGVSVVPFVLDPSATGWKGALKHLLSAAMTKSNCSQLNFQIDLTININMLQF